jgi:hypothetical protein
MSTNEYFSQKPLPDATNNPGYYGGRSASSAPSGYSTPAPPYSSQPHLTPGDRPPQAVSPVSPSPFETVFDDHVYPASAHQPTPNSSMHRLSHQDTGYHGHSPTSPDSMSYNRSPTDSIPLQDHAQRVPSKDTEMQDHVYDASQSGKPRSKARVRFGELGMLGSGRKKIPYVVYFLTLVQVAVFVGEIVKNCKCCTLVQCCPHN